MSLYYWVGNTPGHIGELDWPANWRDASDNSTPIALPINGDSLIFDQRTPIVATAETGQFAGRQYSVTANGSGLNTTAFADVTVGDRFTGNLAAIELASVAGTLELSGQGTQEIELLGNVAELQCAGLGQVSVTLGATSTVTLAKSFFGTQIVLSGPGTITELELLSGTTYLTVEAVTEVAIFGGLLILGALNQNDDATSATNQTIGALAIRQGRCDWRQASTIETLEMSGGSLNAVGSAEKVLGAGMATDVSLKGGTVALRSNTNPRPVQLADGSTVWLGRGVTFAAPNEVYLTWKETT